MIQDPERADQWLVASASDAFLGLQVGAMTLANVHQPDKCAGETCMVHNPSDHHMREWPLHWRDDRGLMERTCEHGVGHPDPDSLAWHVRNGRKWQGAHGCDGCCRTIPTERAPA